MNVSMLVRRFSVFALLALVVACASHPRAEPNVPEAPTQVPPAATNAAPVASTPTFVTVACRIPGAVCTEYRDVPDLRAAQIRDTCGKGGEVLTTCPAEAVAATCTVTKPQEATVVSMVYKAKNRKKTKELVKRSRRGCESRGGEFAAVGR
jgi:hypothetical protein